jgi:hypothetical protein
VTWATRTKDWMKSFLVVLALLATMLVIAGVMSMMHHRACGRLDAERISHLEPGHIHPGPDSIYVKGVGPGPPPSELVAYYEAEAAMENANCGGTGKPGPGD